MSFVDGFDLIALPRARRLARARQRQRWGWLGAVLCSATMLLLLESVGAWRQRAGAQDQGRHRAHLQERVRSVAPTWREAAHLASLLDHAAARTTSLATFGDRRWALHALLDALARAATPALAMQRMHYHAEAKPDWANAPMVFDRDETLQSARLPLDMHRSLPAPHPLSGDTSPRGAASEGRAVGEPNAAKVRLSDVPGTLSQTASAKATATEGVSGDDAGAIAMMPSAYDDAPPLLSADAFDLRRDRPADAALLRVLPHTMPLALTVEGIAHDAASVRAWVTRLQRDPRIAAVIVDAFVRETARPTPSIWGGRASGQPPEGGQSSPIRFRVSLFGRASTSPGSGAQR